MIATAERPLGTVVTPLASASDRTVVRGGGTSLGSLGFTFTVVVAGGGAGCCCSVVTVVVVWAAAGRATNASASARVFDMVVSRKWSYATFCSLAQADNPRPRRRPPLRPAHAGAVAATVQPACSSSEQGPSLNAFSSSGLSLNIQEPG